MSQHQCILQTKLVIRSLLIITIHAVTNDTVLFCHIDRSWKIPDGSWLFRFYCLEIGRIVSVGISHESESITKGAVPVESSAGVGCGIHPGLTHPFTKT